METEWTGDHLSELVKQCLSEGKPVEIDGVGVFLPDRVRGFCFQPSARPQIFIAYGTEDAPAANRLYDALEEMGFGPWLDSRKLLPGQNWARSIENAIAAADFFVPCFSRHSVHKRGGFQAEIRYAMDCARMVPLDEIFIVPVRLDACPLPLSLGRELESVDLFPGWARGLRRISAIIRRQMSRRAKRT